MASKLFKVIAVLALMLAPAQAADKARVASWGVNPVRYCVAQYPQIQAKRIVDRALRAAFMSWSQTCDLKFEEVKKPADANILIWFDPRVFGGRAEVPPFPLFTGQRNLWLNGVSDFNRLGVDYLRALAGHEIGHAIGLWRHSTRTDQIMSENVVRVVVPQWEDIERAVQIYGEKRRVTTPARSSPAVRRSRYRDGGSISNRIHDGRRTRHL